MFFLFPCSQKNTTVLNISTNILIKILIASVSRFQHRQRPIHTHIHSSSVKCIIFHKKKNVCV